MQTKQQAIMGLEPEAWWKVAMATLAAGISWLATLWGMTPPIVQLLLAMMVADVVTGVLAGKRIYGGLSSDKAYIGMRKKGIEIVIVAIIWYAQVHGNIGAPLYDTVAGFFIGQEGLSILENAALAGLPVPEQIKDWLEKLGQSPRAKPQVN